jgi:hypothetical protein
MTRRPFLLFAILLLAVAAIHAAAQSLGSGDESAASTTVKPNGEVCTVCGPIRTE